MSDAVKHIVIVGGGTAGWITAGILAARHTDRSDAGLQITLIESPDVPSVGVGEGTWPTIRKTLSSIGIKEADFLKHCDASFKQGSRFDGWVTGGADDTYHHPFELPFSLDGAELLQAWQSYSPNQSFAQTVCLQASPSLERVAPRQRNMPEFVGALNYAYHLDAVKLAKLLKAFILENLGVNYIQDHVVKIIGDKDANIDAVMCRQAGRLDGDLFIDCTGQSSLLLGQHYGAEFVDQSHILPNDRALVTQISVDPESKIASKTISTAHEAGWIWDIGLPSRRGVGCVYASSFMDDERAEEVLRSYVKGLNCETRLLKFKSGHRSRFWHKNCIAIGLSAGFLEPLEASAIVLVELSAEMLAENLPASLSLMDIEARKFNETFQYRWGRIIDFLKFHYVLSQRPEPYWKMHRDQKTIPKRLQDYMKVWRHRPPNQYDFEQAREVFPVSSYLFVAYGMGMTAPTNLNVKPVRLAALQKQIQTVIRKQKTLAAGLPTNRALLS